MLRCVLIDFATLLFEHVKHRTSLVQHELIGTLLQTGLTIEECN